MKSSTSWPSASRKYSATVRPVRPTRARAPGGSFIGPYTSVTLDSSCLSPSLITPPSIISRYRSLPSRVRSPTPANTEKPPACARRAGEPCRLACATRGRRTVRLCHVVDQLHDEHGLADAGAAEESDFAPLLVGSQQVLHLRRNSVSRERLERSGRPCPAERRWSCACPPAGTRLDASHQNLERGALLAERRRLAVDGKKGRRLCAEEGGERACGPPEGGAPGGSLMGPHWSTGSPSTFIMRPSVARPTGIWTRSG